MTAVFVALNSCDKVGKVGRINNKVMIPIMGDQNCPLPIQIFALSFCSNILTYAFEGPPY